MGRDSLRDDQCAHIRDPGHCPCGTGWRSSSPHILAITQAICLHRTAHGVTGPLFIGIDMHALSVPALEVITANSVQTMVDERGGYTPTPVISHAILCYNKGRTGWFRQAHIKTETCCRMKLLLTHWRNLKRKFLDLENAIRQSLKAFGIKLCGTSRGAFDQIVRSAVADDPLTSELMDAMLTAPVALWKEYKRLHDLAVKFVARDELCRRFIAIPGVSPVTALSFVTAIDELSRFRRSRDVAAYFGLTSRRWQSGTSIDVKGRISKAGDADVRRALSESRVRPDDAVQGPRQGQGMGPKRRPSVAVTARLGWRSRASWR